MPSRPPTPSSGPTPVESTAAEVPARQAGSWKRNAIEWAAVVVAAVTVALLISTTTAQAFSIPSKSMEGTLHRGDRVIVNKWSYRLHPIHRGDIVVFTRPKGEPTKYDDLIKRVIGLPGETVTIAHDHVYIDGHRLSEPYLDAGAITEPVAGQWACTPAAPCKIGKGQIWVMGDNRTDSSDSRYFGPIPESSVVGQAVVRIWPPNRLGRL